VQQMLGYQGDQIGRIFAKWTIVYLLWAFLKIAEVAQINFDENVLGYILAVFFIWSPRWKYGILITAFDGK
jgi:hypothetical protein